MGGLGPMATAYYLELVVKMTDAKSDREHIPMIIFNHPEVPDRTDYILGKSKESPLDAIVSIGKTLVGLGAENISIPCITAHYFYDDILKRIGIPVINMLRETANYLKLHQIDRVGIMATDGTIKAGFFTEELEKQGIKVYTPSEKSQKKVMSIIYDDIKANKPYDIDGFKLVEKELREAGAQVIILGCTELSLIKKDGKTGPGFLDAMEVLALKSIELSGASVKAEYQNLLI
ncbi:MAG: aspartate/glutamate racemase family protein [Acetivibrionales bacterium]